MCSRETATAESPDPEVSPVNYTHLKYSEKSHEIEKNTWKFRKENKTMITKMVCSATIDIVEECMRSYVKRRTFHLIVDHAFECEWLFRILQLVVPSFLLQHFGVLQSARVQNGIQVHVDEIVEVLCICGCNGVASAAAS